VILKETHPQVKFDVFERLNTGSVKLTPQELRHGIYYGDMVLLCEALAKNEEFGRMIRLGHNKRMKLEELVLRFLALRFDGQSYRKPLSGFLNTFAEKHRTLSDNEKTEFTKEFDQTIKAVPKLYGEFAFQVFGAGRHVFSSFNAALYNAEMIAAAELVKRSKRMPEEELVLNTIQRLFENDETFRKAVVQATSDEVQVKTRSEILTKALLKL
jgi:hypothetical protein